MNGNTKEIFKLMQLMKILIHNDSFIKIIPVRFFSLCIRLRSFYLNPANKTVSQF